MEGEGLVFEDRLLFLPLPFTFSPETSGGKVDGEVGGKINRLITEGHRRSFKKKQRQT